MKNVMITGATGMTGGLILTQCLNSNDIGKVTVIVRQPTGITHEKLTEIIHRDFSDFSPMASCFRDQDIAYFCLGVYTGAVDRELFKTITVDYTKAFAQTLKQNSPHATFCFLSGQGADQSGKSRMIFARDKGVAERNLISTAFDQLYIFRPAYIYPVFHRAEPNFSYRVMRFLYPVMKRIYADGVIPSTDLAAAMFVTGLKGAGKLVLENKDIREIASRIKEKQH